MSLQSHDTSQRSTGFLSFFCGLMIAFANEYSTNFLEESWMRFRKKGAAARGITRKVGGALITFINNFPTDTELYKLMTTNLEE